MSGYHTYGNLLKFGNNYSSYVCDQEGKPFIIPHGFCNCVVK